MSNKQLAEYKNGNYKVKIYSDGTKERITEDFEFVAEFPESIDIKVTNQCDMGCGFCHEGSKIDGKHGDIDFAFFDTLRPFTEVALGGGNFLAYPEYLRLLEKLKERQIFANVTLHQAHLERNLQSVKDLIEKDLIKGLGVSFSGDLKQLKFLISDLNYEHLVVHVINGLITVKELQSMSKFPIKPKILILGYKDFGRGISYRKGFEKQINEEMIKVNRQIKNILLNFPVVSFDNLALEQIDLKGILSESQYNEFYMGDDGQHTMYIDLVEGVFAKNSRSFERFPIKNTIDEMFKVVKGYK